MQRVPAMTSRRAESWKGRLDGWFIFVFSFMVCAIAAPIVAFFVLSWLVPPICFYLWYLPPHMLWTDGLLIGTSDRLAPHWDSVWVRLIPIFVWICTGITFGFVARRLGTGKKVLAAFMIIFVVTLIMNGVAGAFILFADTHGYDL